jgi:hypothetical protein
LIKNWNLPIPKTSIKDFLAPEEAFSPQKRTSSTSKHEISSFFSILWVMFALLDPVSGSGFLIRIRIHWPD